MPRKSQRPAAAKPAKSSAETVRATDGHDTRILSLLMLLLSSEEPVTRAQIFERFPDYQTGDPEAGARKFERDKRLLRQIGVVIEEDSDSEGYRVDPRQYTLPPIDFAEDERLALALAAEAWRDAEGLSYRELVHEALRKLSLGDAAGRPVRPPAQLAVQMPGQETGPRIRKLLETLEQAIVSRKRVQMHYAGGRTAGPRAVDPYRLVYQTGHWFLVAHCHLREAPRTFRVDRISRLRVAPHAEVPDFEVPNHLDASALVQRSPWLFQASPDHAPADVTLQIDRERPWMADEDFGPDARRDVRSDGSTRVRFRTANPDYVVIRVLDAAGHMQVLSPPDLRVRVAAAAAAIAAGYKDVQADLSADDANPRVPKRAR